MLREFSAKKAFVSQRVEALDREVDETKAEAVIFYTNLYGRWLQTWDMPNQKKSLASRGIVSCVFG